MNYLAHLYFSAPSPLAWAGSLMGDFVKGSDFSGLPDELVRYLKLHRHIDTYTVASSAFQRSRRRLDPRFRYARSVMVDVFYDHFLARNWDRFDSRPLSEFAREVYSGLESCHAVLSRDLQAQLPRMIEHDWLTSYRRPEVVGRVLKRLEERIDHRFPLSEGVGELERCQAELEGDFFDFMAEAEEIVALWETENS